MEIIGRKKETADLERLYTSQSSEFLCVYGRRRVGKTYLIKQFFANRFAFYTTGTPSGSGIGMKDQLSNFAASISEYSSEPCAGFKSWSEAFAKLRELIESIKTPGKKVIFIDEMPWFDTPKSKFIPALDYFWNSFASSRGDVMLIACGSAASWMINKLLRAGGGLYNRVTMRMRLNPFTLSECEEYYEAKGMALSRRQIIENHMIFGGIPYYMGLIDPALTQAANIDAMFFAGDALLDGEYEILYRSLFKEADLHMKIIEVLSTKKMGMSGNDLRAATGMVGGALSRALSELELSGFIKKYRPFGKKSKGTLYHLTDPYTLFYFNFIRQNNDPHFWQKYIISPAHSAWSGYAFELVCMMHADKIVEKTGGAYVITNTSSWRSEKVKGGAQIDLVIDRSDGLIDLCEMKYIVGEYEVSEKDAARFRELPMLFRNETGTKKSIRNVLVTTYGLKQNRHAESVQYVITMDGLFD